MANSDTYHHGALRRALMDGALSVIASQGLSALSLRAVAAAAGVSHAAPYHHFADKAALVRAIGYEGLRLLDERMAAAEVAAGDDAGARLLAIGVAYVEFAAASPAHFAAMSAPDMRTGDEGGEAHGEPWERLVAAVVACQRTGLLAPGDPLVPAVGLWALVEGLGRLWDGGALAPLPESADGAASLADRVLTAMLPLMTPALPAPARSTRGSR